MREILPDILRHGTLADFEALRKVLNNPLKRPMALAELKKHA